MVFLGKTLDKLIFMLKNSSREVRSNPYIQSSIFMVGHNINIKLFFQGIFIISNLQYSVMPETNNRLNTCGFLIETFRNDSLSLSFPRSFIGNLKVLALRQFRFLINTFRNDRQGDDRSIQEWRTRRSFPPGYFWPFSFVFSGGYKGVKPPYGSHSSFPKSSIGNLKVFVFLCFFAFPRGVIGGLFPPIVLAYL